METIGDKLKRFLSGLSTEAKRTTGLVQAKMELNALQQELNRREIAVGRKLSQLNRRGAIKDKFILEAMKEELEALADCERRIDAALKDIQGLTIFDVKGDLAQKHPSDDKDDGEPSDLDSFDVG